MNFVGILIFVVLAAIQWLFLIRRIPVWFVRILVQVPLLVLTVFFAWFLGMLLTTEDVEVVQARLDAQIIDSSFVVRGDLRVTVDGTGSITPLRQVPLTFQLPSSPVDQIFVETGDYVALDTIIATLEDTDIQQTLADAEIALNLQQIAFDALSTPPRPEDLAAAEAAIESAQAQYNAAYQSGVSVEDREIARIQSEIARNQLWQTQLARDALQPPDLIQIDVGDTPLLGDIDDVVDSTLQGINAANQAGYDAQVRQANTAINQVELGVEIADTNSAGVNSRGADPGSLAAANAGRIQAEIAYNRLINGATDLQIRQSELNLRLANLAYEQAELALGQTELKAPFAGVIAQLNLVEGELPPQNIAALLIDDSGYYVDLPIDETDVADVQVGQRVEFEVDALRSTIIQGEVSSIAYTPLGIEGVVAYNVRVDVLPTDAPIRAGMTVTGSIIVLEQLDVLLLRNNFIRIDRSTGDAFVTVRTGEGRFRESLVLLGERGDVYSEVLAGIDEGDEVVLLPRNEVDLPNRGGFGPQG